MTPAQKRTLAVAGLFVAVSIFLFVNSQIRSRQSYISPEDQLERNIHWYETAVANGHYPEAVLTVVPTMVAEILEEKTPEPGAGEKLTGVWIVAAVLALIVVGNTLHRGLRRGP